MGSGIGCADRGRSQLRAVRKRVQSRDGPRSDRSLDAGRHVGLFFRIVMIFLSVKAKTWHGTFSSLFVPSLRPMNMNFEPAGSARTPADEPTSAGRLHPGADRAAWRSD